MKILERIVDGLIRQVVSIDDYMLAKIKSNKNSLIWACTVCAAYFIKVLEVLFNW